MNKAKIKAIIRSKDVKRIMNALPGSGKINNTLIRCAINTDSPIVYNAVKSAQVYQEACHAIHIGSQTVFDSILMHNENKLSKYQKECIGAILRSKGLFGWLEYNMEVLYG